MFLERLAQIFEGLLRLTNNKHYVEHSARQSVVHYHEGNTKQLRQLYMLSAQKSKSSARFHFIDPECLHTCSMKLYQTLD